MKVVNILSGVGMITAGVIGILKGDQVAGYGLVTAGVTKIIAHDDVQKKIKKLAIATHTDLLNGNKPISTNESK